MYEQPKVEQLLVGLTRHIKIAQDTSLPKDKRLTSLNNLQEVLEYVVHVGYSTEPNEILTKFFSALLVKISIASVSIHSNPVRFDEELGFLATLLKICDTK